MRRGIDNLRRKFGGSDEDSASEEEVSAARRGKNKAIEVVHEVEDSHEVAPITQVASSKPKKTKQKQVRSQHFAYAGVKRLMTVFVEP